MVVVAFRDPKAQSSKLIEVTENTFENVIATALRQRVYAGTKIGTIADKTGLCHATVSKIICGDTRFPRMSTVIKLLKFLKFKMYIEV